MVESFKLDHTQVSAPYVRFVQRIVGPKGDVVCKYHISLIKPNASSIPTSAIHTLEHLFAIYGRDYLAEIIDISPMGCRTGFSLMVFREMDVVELQKIVIKILKKIMDTEKIPTSTVKECGNHRDHFLADAKKYAAQVLEDYHGKRI